MSVALRIVEGSEIGDLGEIFGGRNLQGLGRFTEYQIDPLDWRHCRYPILNLVNNTPQRLPVT